MYYAACTKFQHNIITIRENILYFCILIVKKLKYIQNKNTFTNQLKIIQEQIITGVIFYVTLFFFKIITKNPEKRQK